MAYYLINALIMIIKLQVLCVDSLRTAKEMKMDTSVQFIGNNELECLILSKKYRSNYLFAVSSLHKLSIFWRDVMIWAPVFLSSPSEFTEKDKHGVWIFKPVTNRPNTYYLQNEKYGEYLFAIEKFKIDEKITNRRMIFTYKSPKVELDEKYMWYFKKVDNGYEIWNVQFNERNLSF